MTLEFWSDGYPRMHTVFPDGAEHGAARVAHVTPSKESSSLTAIRAMTCGRGFVRAGETVRLPLRMKSRLRPRDLPTLI